ncbi:MAG: ABC transporter substrate-binding protein [Asgard group archaeon]|nr:ABC transporter substrate-binding protein [Asgard group archaeon]
MKMKKLFLVVLLVTTLTFSMTILMTNAVVDDSVVASENLDQASILSFVTRHDVTITNEFTSAFLASDYAINAGITSLVFNSASTDAGWKKLLEDPSKSIDVAWGGGPALFNTMDDYGLLYHIDNQTLIDLLNAVVPDEVAGLAIKSYDASDNLIWIGNAISSFGFTVNHDFLDDYGLPVPNTWEELATPTYYLGPNIKAVSFGDPPLTTSNTKIVSIILQAFGWEEGWSILTRIGANSGIYPGSVDTRAAVVTGDVGIGMTIDFYGVIAKRENPNTEYIIPEGQSIVNGDPIAIASFCDNFDGANAFFEYLFSLEGQNTWMHEGLDRLPAVADAFQTPYGQTRTDLYSLYNDTLANEGIEFDENLETDLLQFTIYYFHETIAGLHNNLRNTWGTLLTALDDETINGTQFQDLAYEMGEIPYTMADALTLNEEYQSSATRASELETEWRSMAKARYANIICQIEGTCEDEETPFIIAPVLISTIFMAALTIIRRRKQK